MGGFTDFGAAITKPASAIAVRTVDDDRPGTNAWMRGVLSGQQPATAPTPPRLTPSETWTITLFYAYMEIAASLETLESIATLARRAPSKLLGVDPGDQLRLYVEGFLSEAYVLRQRCASLLRVVQRAYRNEPDAQDIARTLDRIDSRMTAALDSLTRARGAHVHQARFRDFELDRLRTMRLVAGSDRRLLNLYSHALRGIRRAKVSQMRDNLAKLRQLLDDYFSVVSSVTFDAAGAQRVPSARRLPR